MRQSVLPLLTGLQLTILKDVALEITVPHSVFKYVFHKTIHTSGLNY